MEKIIKIALLAFNELRAAQRVTGKISTAAMLSLFAFFTTLGMIGCGVASLWIFLAPRVGNAEAALWSALLLFGLTVGLGIASWFVIRGGRAPAADRTPFIEEVGAEVTRAVAESKGAVLLSALLAGMAYGSSRK